MTRPRIENLKSYWSQPLQHYKDDIEDISALSRATVFKQEWIDNCCRLEGFEKVLDRRFKCNDCSLMTTVGCVESWMDITNAFPCHKFILTDKTKAEIKLKDREIEDTKIDTHPRYFIREEMMYYIPEVIPTLLMDFNPTKEVQIRQALIKLELIL